MKLLVIVMTLLSASILAFDLPQFENDICPRSIVPGRSPGFYSSRPALSFQEANLITYLQKVTVRGETFYRVTNDLGSYNLRTRINDVKDFVVVGENIWLLSGYELIEFDSFGKEVSRHRYSPNSGRYEKPMGMDLRGDEILIAQGTMGLVSFDLKTKKFSFRHRSNTLQEDGRRSMAVSVTWEGNLAYVALATASEAAFTGVVVINLDDNSMVNAAAYKQRRYGVLDVQAKVYFKNGKVYLNNGGWIHSFSKLDILTKDFPKPRWQSIAREFQGRRSYAMIRGDFIFDQGKLYGCALFERTPITVSTQL